MQVATVMRRTCVANMVWRCSYRLKLCGYNYFRCVVAVVVVVWVTSCGTWAQRRRNVLVRRNCNADTWERESNWENRQSWRNCGLRILYTIDDNRITGFTHSVERSLAYGRQSSHTAKALLFTSRTNNGGVLFVSLRRMSNDVPKQLLNENVANSCCCCCCAHCIDRRMNFRICWIPLRAMLAHRIRWNVLQCDVRSSRRMWNPTTWNWKCMRSSSSSSSNCVWGPQRTPLSPFGWRERF